MNKNFSYLPELDGIRAIAIIFVLLYHSSEKMFPGGFIGVDIFFVISGFLITSLLLKEYEKSKDINIKLFYIRRFLRLIPALIVLLIVLLICTYLFLDYETAKGNSIDTFITLFYMSNWARAFQIHPPNFLGHTWSLSIEEQFYILWPLSFLYLLKKIKSKNKLFYSLVGLCLFSWLIKLWMILNSYSYIRLYNGLDTRVESILFGAAFSIFLSLNENSITKFIEKSTEIFKYVIPSIFVLLIIILFQSDWKSDLYFLILLPIIELFTVMLIYGIFIIPNSIYYNILRNKYLVWIGMVSYGLYLWHYPIYRWIMIYYYKWTTILPLGLIITFLITTISYYAIEKPFLKLKNKFVSQSKPKKEFNNRYEAINVSK